MRNFRLTLILILFAAVLTGCGAQRDPIGVTKPQMTVDVMLEENENITILGENPVSVPVGGDARIAVELPEGFKIDAVSHGAEYEDGVVTLSGVQFPTTVELTIRQLKNLTVEICNDSMQGTLTSSVEFGKIWEDTEVTVEVAPADGLVFLGYSTEAPSADGGNIVCTAREYTFRMTEDVKLYTNYYKAGSGAVMVYDGNGAVEGTLYDVFREDSPFLGPNAPINQGQFTRDGYVLCGYNTERDGSGTYYGTGWSVILPEESEQLAVLYAQWLPVTEQTAFTYTVSGKTVTITGYEGDHEILVIPETIDGKAVTKIAAHAFQNGKFKTLYLSRNLRTIDNEAFLGCKELTTLYMCDMVTSVKDEAFADCDQLQKLYVLACTAPRYASSRNGTFKLKYQRLISAQGKKMIFHAGSNVSYGVDIPTVHDLLNNEYAGVNFGCNQGTSSVFFTEVASAHMNPGDILVLCPEYHEYQYGYNEMNVTTWQIFEGAYNAYADVDIRNYTKVFSSFGTFNANRIWSAGESYEKYHTEGFGQISVTKFGVHNVNHNGQTEGLEIDKANWLSGGNWILLNLSLLEQDYNDNLNRAIDRVVDKGGKVYISFPSILRDVIPGERLKDTHLQAFKEAVANRFPKATVISEPGNYIMNYREFYNTCYHLTTAASKTRAKLLVEDILAQFAKEAQ